MSSPLSSQPQVDKSPKRRGANKKKASVHQQTYMNSDIAYDIQKSERIEA